MKRFVTYIGIAMLAFNTIIVGFWIFLANQYPEHNILANFQKVQITPVGEITLSVFIIFFALAPILILMGLTFKKGN